MHWYYSPRDARVCLSTAARRRLHPCSAQACLSVVLDALLRLFAPFLPFVTEEVWSWWRSGSIHRAPWPDRAALRDVFGGADQAALDVAGWLLSEIRGAKSVAKRSLRTPVR
ncbi:MAG: class I tRNA ligase family protein [Streptomycetales bacterium]